MAINKILFVTLTNIGDVILTLPALDLLRRRFPQAGITVVSGPRAAGLFESNPAIAGFVAYDKHAGFWDKLRFFRRLSRERFDLVVDLRNSLLGVFLGKQRRFCAVSFPGAHASQAHLAKVRAITGLGDGCPKGGSVFISGQDREYARLLLAGCGKEKPVALSPGARSGIKRWPKENFLELALWLRREGRPVVLVGDKDEAAITGPIAAAVPGVIDLAGRTTLAQLAGILSNSALLVTNDSAGLHLAGYLDVPTVAVFGPTDESRYGPWSRVSFTVSGKVSCRPCRKPQCPEGTVRCMKGIPIAEVKDAVLKALASKPHFG